MALETEIAFFNRKKDEFLKNYAGQYLLIKGEELIGAFTTEVQAYEAGLQKFGNEVFLIKLAGPETSANYFALHFGLLRAHP